MTDENQNNYGGIAADKLTQFIERIEGLESQKADIAADIREVYTYAKNDGFDVKAMREVIKLRKKEAHERDEQDAMLDLYRKAVGV